jgi:hypothetical protein
MSETPERIEREMFEIRSGMASDMTDFRKQIEPQVIAEQVKKTVRQRLQEAFFRLKANLQATLKTKQQEILDSAKHQLSLAREAGENRDPAPLTEAVKSDPRPLVLVAIVLAVTLFMVRKITGGGRG